MNVLLIQSKSPHHPSHLMVLGVREQIEQIVHHGHCQIQLVHVVLGEEDSAGMGIQPTLTSSGMQITTNQLN